MRFSKFAKLAMLGTAALAVLANASTESGGTRVEYHTASGLLEPGCARSFHASIPSRGLVLNVTVSRDSQEPVISSQYAPGTPGSTAFEYCYNSAYLPLYDGGVFTSHALLVRCQNLINASVPYAVGPSYLVLATQPAGAVGSGGFEPMTLEDVVFQPTLPTENYGTEDPRLVYDAETGVYFLFYSAVQTEPNNAPDVISRLALATTTDPRDINAWKKYGPIIANDPSGGYAWSKSGALLMAPTGQKSLLIFGDSSIENGLQTAAPSADFLSYTYNKTIFLPIRSDSWDSNLVESGPPPIKLANSPFYFFFYNSGRLGYPSAKPNWNTQYNIGFLLLDAEDPATIVFRSEVPIMSPELAWEQGVYPYLGLTPNVVFVEGARHADPVANQPDALIFWYGAADSCVGAATVTIQISEDRGSRVATE